MPADSCKHETFSLSQFNLYLVERCAGQSDICNRQKGIEVPLNSITLHFMSWICSGDSATVVSPDTAAGRTSFSHEEAAGKPHTICTQQPNGSRHAPSASCRRVSSSPRAPEPTAPCILLSYSWPAALAPHAARAPVFL